MRLAFQFYFEFFLLLLHHQMFIHNRHQPAGQRWSIPRCSIHVDTRLFHTQRGQGRFLKQKFCWMSRKKNMFFLRLLLSAIYWICKTIVCVFGKRCVGHCGSQNLLAYIISTAAALEENPLLTDEPSVWVYISPASMGIIHPSVHLGMVCMYTQQHAGSCSTKRRRTNVGCVKVSANSSRRSFFLMLFPSIRGESHRECPIIYTHTRRKEKDRPASARKKKKREKDFLMLMRVDFSVVFIDPNNFRPFSLSNTYWTLRNSRRERSFLNGADWPFLYLISPYNITCCLFFFFFFPLLTMGRICRVS